MAFDADKVTLFARTDARGKNITFGIKAKDRQRHVYVIGKTGMGKSTLLENMAVQDIQNGEGLAFIDPHGSAAETLLNYIPAHRIDDVLYFAPFDTDQPVSFNIMEDVGPDKRHLVVSGLMSVFKKIWVDAWSARMEYILSNTLLALLEYPDSTLLGVNRMLSDKDYRKKVIENITDPSVKSFWVDEFLKYNERYMQEAGDAIKNKIGQFTANPVIRNIIGQPKSSFDIRKMMDEKKILIMNLSKGLIGETNANLLGSMLTTRIYLAAMSRADLSPEKMRDMPNFYFYVDEFQSFANATFSNILSEARKYHLNLTIAHQYISQMEEEVRDAVFGNVGTIISFRVGPFDAEVLETIFTPQFLATDIVNLSFAQIYLTLMIDGIGSQPFSATTLAPIVPPSISYKEMAIAASRKKFAHSRAEVEEAIHKFHEPVNPPYKKSDAPRHTTKPKMPHGIDQKKQPTRDFSRTQHTAHTASTNSTSDEITPGKETTNPGTASAEVVAEKTPTSSRESYVRKSPEPTDDSNEKELGDHKPPTSRPERGTSRQSARQTTYAPQKTNSKQPYQGTRDRNNSASTYSNKQSKEDPKEDLRAVLRGMVTKPEIKKEETKKKEFISKKDTSSNSLKDALKAALVTGHVETNQQGDDVQEKNEKNKTPTHVANNESDFVSTDKKDGVTTKQLERMMRVTTSDKPPV